MERLKKILIEAVSFIKKGLLSIAGAVRSGIPLLPGKIKKFFRSIPAFVSAAMKIFYRYLESLQSSPRTRYLTILWSLVIVFAGVSVLSSSNPYRLIIPGLAYPFPVRDQRTTVKMYGISLQTGKIVQYSRRVLMDSSVERNAERILFTLSAPQELRENLKAGTEELENLPELGYAVRKIWFRAQGNGGDLIIDMRGQTLESESKLFLKSRSLDEKGQGALLDNYFTALSVTLLAMPGKINGIVYLIDGTTKSVAGMQMDLRKRYESKDFNP